ncbi:MAG TPA: hypothetical protein VH300_11610 [Thermoleophilaceae bacterium]|nr:hypothetical protein [Thermoleophilaceae bacterium]
MAEDRFGDLGPGERERRPSAAELLAAGDEAELAAEHKLERRKAPKPSSAYTWVVGIAFLLLIIVVGFNSLPNAGEGLKGPKAGQLMPAFAAPLATGSVDADVNIKATGKEPGKTLACAVHVRSALNGCDLRKRPSVVVFAGTRGADCLPGFDRIERVRKAFPQVNFAGILIRMGRDSAAKTVRKGGWGFPIAFDRDGQLTNVYGIGVCPATVFAKPGGRVVTTKLGKLTQAQLRAQIRRIL